MGGEFLNKQKLSIIILSLSFIIIIFLIIYTAYCNEKTVFASAQLNQNNKTIILDAGHGTPDGGAVASDGTLEKDLNLIITQKLKDVLKLYGYNIVLTRTGDNSIHSSDAATIRQKKVSDIHNREKIINKHPDAIFISIHQNKFYDPSVNGTQIFYSSNNVLSADLAKQINNSIIESVQPNNPKQIKKSGTDIYLLYHSEIPSVMIECGFLSNYNDLQKLKKDEFQKQITLAIVQGILHYSKG